MQMKTLLFQDFSTIEEPLSDEDSSSSDEDDNEPKSESVKAVDRFKEEQGDGETKGDDDSKAEVGDTKVEVKEEITDDPATAEVKKEVEEVSFFFIDFGEKLSFV